MTPRKPWVRALYLALAVVSIAVAVAGVFIPGLPSTEFVLLASWAAARSSPRLHRWLHEHRWFGPMLHNWHNGRMVTRRAKIMATVSMTVCMVVMTQTIPHPWIVWPLCLTMVAVLVWIWQRPEPPGDHARTSANVPACQQAQRS
ncbi:YbaN family protein [Achromobacter spanius]|uniref:DUF454 domain-containing protein n=1 Tax=Achromobacter spanius TaxID=217203 RepID=A0A2S0I1J1_9BURK|nr:YbaN family protein [Achromobacter spanius]AVJ25878.1 hypothetical protein CLM73_01385 [Achromobacter spanius]